MWSSGEDNQDREREKYLKRFAARLDGNEVRKENDKTKEVKTEEKRQKRIMQGKENPIDRTARWVSTSPIGGLYGSQERIQRLRDLQARVLTNELTHEEARIKEEVVWSRFVVKLNSTHYEVRNTSCSLD